jgi:hypothetical protein
MQADRAVRKRDLAVEKLRLIFQMRSRAIWDIPGFPIRVEGLIESGGN